MRKLMVLSLGIFFISGCLVRTYTVYKPRVNTKVSGNRGYIVGKPKEGEEPRGNKPSLGKMRPITVFEIELGAHAPESITGKPAEVSSSKEKENSASAKGVSTDTIEAEINKPQEQPEEVIPVSSIEEKSKVEYKYYTVRKNDTLQKISSKFYGTTRKWKLIYEENKGIIKNPDRVYPGIKIRIPQLK